jgi:8-oxo-dGTP diphosphatase
MESMKAAISEIDLPDDLVGTKIAIINKDKVLAIKRDDKPDIPFPGFWDLPGGARDPGETAIQTIVREVKEELNYDVEESEITWHGIFPGVTDQTKRALFVVVEASDEAFDHVKLGDEGTDWQLIPINEFVERDDVVPGMQDRLRAYIKAASK